MSDPFPAWFLSALAAVTVCSIMFGIGLGTTPRELVSVWRRPGLTLRALFAVLVAVPAMAWAVCVALDLPRAVSVGIMLMAIAPGAPLLQIRRIALAYNDLPVEFRISQVNTAGYEYFSDLGRS